MITTVKFLATFVAPKPDEVDYWIDLSDNPYKGTIKYFNGTEWVRLQDLGGSLDLTKYYNRNEVNSLLNDKASVDSVESKLSDSDASNLIKDIQADSTVNELKLICTKYDGSTVILKLPAADTGHTGVITSEKYKDLVTKADQQAIYTELYAIAESIRSQYQRKLIAGSNIKIDGNVISATGGGSSTGGGASDWDSISNKPQFAEIATSGDYNDLANKLTAGNGVSISTDNIITVDLSGIDFSEALSTKADKADTYTKAQVDQKVSSVYRIKGSVAYTSLPTSGNTVGDTYNITDSFTLSNVTHPAGTNIVYTSNGWDALSGSFDTTSIENSISGVDTKLTQEVSRAKTAENTKVDKVDGKQLSTNDYTTAEKNKLAGIEDSANNYTLDKTKVENVLTGDLTSHTHNTLYDAIGKATQALADAKKYTDEQVANITAPGGGGDVTAHNSSSTAHADIRTAITTSLTEAKRYTDTTINNLIGTAPEILNTLGELASAIQSNESVMDSINNSISTKVDKVEGKGLSSNDYTTTEKSKLAGIESNANNYSLPKASSTELGGVKTGYTTSGKNYSISVDTNGNAYVNVPWTDTVYTHPSNTARTSGLYKITVDSLGHVTGATAVVKDDIVALGIAGGDVQVSVTNEEPTLSWGTISTIGTINGVDLTVKMLDKPTYTWSDITSKPTFATVATSGKYSDLTGTPTTLKNPTALTFGSKTYDGSVAATILASDLGALTSHQTLNSLTINRNGTLVDTYNPSTVKTININAATSITVPTGLTAGALTTAGVIALSFTSGYSIPTTTKQTQWDTAYSFVIGITGTDADSIINKWSEVVSFLDEIDDTNTLDSILNGINTSISTEVNRAKSAESTLTTNLSTHTADTSIHFTAAERTKLSGIAANANNYSHPTGSGNLHIPSGGASGQFLKWSADGTAVWAADNNTTYGEATTTSSGLMSSTDKSKLNGIATGANNYSLPASTTTDLGGVKVGYTTNGKNYKVQLDTSNNAYVNVPWESGSYTHPTNTAYTSGLYKIVVDNLGHVTSAAAVTKTDITNLGIPSSDTTYSTATSSTSGLMSSVDKAKLDSISYYANDYTLYAADSSTLGGIKIGYSESNQKYAVQLDANNRAYVYVPWTGSSYSNATTSSDGLMSSTDKTKLNGIETGANKYTLPAASSTVLGGVITGTGIGNSSGTISVTYGTTAGTACQGNDSRLSDARPANGGTAAMVTMSSISSSYPHSLLMGSSNSVYTNSAVYCIPSDGLLYAVGFYEQSDRNLKKNIEVINDSDNIPELVSFDWKRNDKKSYGFIAQNLEELGYTELVHTDEKGIKTVNYDAALSLTIGKLKAKIEEQDKVIKELQNKIEQIWKNV